ncbi:FKBP-type peptidyl-prolyl cis-trans isomerase [Parapedobacter sp. 10938]|uniref:FKBP-type peptidyl-prolyl cis-trans isomerase n=1 Tax=Parapedobacter flavus TaxID=3110225 RepID=UPI002DBFAE92|nr:FKBP-type peptidyl-prolyl cis-trans isomerase [Parapedobacter sp. 10938]MEC3878822.1 FKBP-type peptidyl-prolyl cis-trans isomerase [Parapedobacter sp. 10938]
MKFLNVGILSSALLVTCGFVSAQQETNGSVPVLTNQSDSIAYAFGASVARDLKRTGIETVNAEVLAQAISDVFAGKESPLNEVQERELIMQAITAAREKIDIRKRNEAQVFMEKNKTRAGVITTPSGLQYEVIREGTGARPTLRDTVTVHYKGQLTNGNVFDSSYDRGQLTTFPLERVIVGWQEGLQLMPAGAHYRMYVPYELGYGERGAGQDIPPYSPLIFDVELVSVQPAVVTPAVVEMDQAK